MSCRGLLSRNLYKAIPQPYPRSSQQSTNLAYGFRVRPYWLTDPSSRASLLVSSGFLEAAGVAMAAVRFLSSWER